MFCWFCCCWLFVCISLIPWTLFSAVDCLFHYATSHPWKSFTCRQGPPATMPGTTAWRSAIHQGSPAAPSLHKIQQWMSIVAYENINHANMAVIAMGTTDIHGNLSPWELMQRSPKEWGDQSSIPNWCTASQRCHIKCTAVSGMKIFYTQHSMNTMLSYN